MQKKVIAFTNLLRKSGIRVSVAEGIDAFNAQCVQNHAYRFGTYDCRHYVDDLAEHLCGKPHVSAAARRIARPAKNNAPAAGLGCGDEPRPLPALGDLHKA